MGNQLGFYPLQVALLNSFFCYMKLEGTPFSDRP